MNPTGHPVPLNPPTAQQRAALDAQGVSVAVVAGAGSGKTKVLTDRYLGHLESTELQWVQQVVALTFTEKAARELRDRVRAQCRRKLEQGSSDHDWRTILWALEAAPINTFHSYCTTLLRRYPLEAGVEPGFRVADETISASLREAAVRICLRKWLAASDPGFLDQALRLGLTGMQEVLADLLSDRAGRDYQALAEKPIEEILESWARLRDEQLIPACQVKLRQKYEVCQSLIASHPCSLKTMIVRMSQLRASGDQLLNGRLTEEVLEEVRKLLILTGVQAKHWPSPEVWELVKAALRDLKDEIDSTLKYLKSSPEADHILAEQGRTLARLAAECVAVYDHQKSERGVLDFTDLQDRLLKLVRDGDSALLDRIRGEFLFLLVDEFQDTDPVQAEILRALAGAGFGDGRLFLVGDAKQSIYGFRGARPKLLTDFREEFPQTGRLGLTENFRSEPEIIDFVNTLFEPVFPGDEHRLSATRKRTPGSVGPRVERVWATESDEPGVTTRVRDARVTEASWLARLVADRLQNGWTIYDSSARVYRNAHAGDVVFLFRTLNDSAIYERALADAGLEFYLVGGAAFFAQQEIIDMINLLSAIEDESDELALLGSLRSPAFGVSDDGLFWLSTSEFGSLPRGLARLVEIPELRGRDLERAARARRLFAEWREIKDSVPMARLVERVLEDSGYEVPLLAEPMGERKRANCRKLVEQARQFDRQGGWSLADLVSRLIADRKRPPREQLASTTDEYGNAVRLMTIHQSKGLEFPIVVVPDLNRKNVGPRGSVDFHEELGLVASTKVELQAENEHEGPDGGEASGSGDVQQSLGWVLSRALRALEEEQESQRLFYVATTRARDYLILSAGMGTGEKAQSHAMRLMDERFDRVTGHQKEDQAFAQAPPMLGTVNTPPQVIESELDRTQQRRSRYAAGIAVAAAIDRTLASDAQQDEPDLDRLVPEVLDLGVQPGVGLRDQQLLQLLTQALGDPEIFTVGEEAIEAILERAAGRVVPRASVRQIQRAVPRLTRWIPDAEVRCAEPALRRWAKDWIGHRTLGEASGSMAVELRVPSLVLTRDLGGELRIVVPLLSELRETCLELAQLQAQLMIERLMKQTGEPVKGMILSLGEDGSWDEETVPDCAGTALDAELRRVLEARALEYHVSGAGLIGG